jgi:RNA-directed DNA polymerase
VGNHEGPNLTNEGEQLSLSDEIGESEKKLRSSRLAQTGSRTESETGRDEEIHLNYTACTQEESFVETKTDQLMEKIVERNNLLQAYGQVKRNGGAPGIDGMTVEKLGQYLRSHWPRLKEELCDGRCEPENIRAVEIPKPDGGMRQLGIPTVVDRFIQQAVLQIMTPIFDKTFSESSFGFRPKRSAHDALKQAQAYVKEKRLIVVDMDLEKFFDEVNHDLLMSRIARKVKDKRLLKLIRKFLQAGIMKDGKIANRVKGTPQGGPLSPLLANILLDDLDKELEKRGHRFCRYADDCNIYVRTIKSGERVLKSITHFIEKKLKLRVNQEKSAVAFIEKRKFLGYRLLRGGKLGIAPKSVKRFKESVTEITNRSRGKSLEVVMDAYNLRAQGWITYFKMAGMRNISIGLDEWVRRKLRCYRIKQRKRTYSIVKYLMELGVPEEIAWYAKKQHGWWKLSNIAPVKWALSNHWFEEQGLISLEKRWLQLNNR